jgi:hypothetical protein
MGIQMVWRTGKARDWKMSASGFAGSNSPVPLQVYRTRWFAPCSIAPVGERDYSRALLVLYPPNPNAPAAIGIDFVNPLHAERLALGHALLWFAANYFNARRSGLRSVMHSSGSRPIISMRG